MIKVSGQQANDIFFDESDEFDVVEKGKWEADGKYQYCKIIFKKDGKCFRITVSRSGSYHTDWYYNFEYEHEFECEEVTLKEIVVRKWVIVDG